MKTHVKIASFLIVIGLISMAAYHFILPIFEDKVRTATSDAKGTKGHIIIGMDNFIGYFPLCSPEMKRRMRQGGYLLECQDDNADYAARMSLLDRNKINFAVGTVDSYILGGAKENYPGTIVAVLDESKGGDALVAWKDKISSLDDLRKSKDLKISYTPDSPSHHLLKALAVHFDIENLKNTHDWQVESNGSEEALKNLLSKKSNAAVLWEPDVSRALKNKNIVRILGTEKTQQLIVDILVVNRDFAQDNPNAVKQLLKTYFRTLKHYRANPDQLMKDVKKSTGLNKKEIKTMLGGIEWQSLSQNAEKWFGVSTRNNLSEEALLDTIESAVDILINYGSLSQNPLPNRDPYSLTNSEFITHLFRQMTGSSGFGTKSSSVKNALQAISAKEWQRLKEFGTLKVRPIIFSSGSDQLTLDGKHQLDLAAENLKHYPAFRVAVRGHTGNRGDKKANKTLSQDRADAVVRYLEITHDITPARLRSMGYGGAKPLVKKKGESRRAFNYRLPRVELVLMGEDL